MNIKDFTEAQKQALLDLVTLAMYADGHLASAEDERVLRLLETMGFTQEYERNQHYDAAVSRIRQHAQSKEAARTHTLTLAKLFTSGEQRNLVDQVLDEVVRSDSRVTPQESSFLTLIRAALQR